MTSHPTSDDLALVALGEDVDAEVLEHVGSCPTCSDEIDALQQVVLIGRSLGADDQLVAPDPQVWQRIVAEVDSDQTGSQLGGVSVLERPGTDRQSSERGFVDDGTGDELAARRRATPRRATPRPRRAPVALAAAAALVVGLAGGYALKGLTDQGPDVASTQLNALPGWPGASGTATVEDGANGQRTLVVAVELPATVSVDGTMEVWMSDTRAREMVSMGTMTDGSARFAVPASFDLAAHPIVDVSLEPRNDGDPGHSDISVVRGRLNV